MVESPNNAANSRSHLRSLEANSGAVFMRKLALKVDPVNAPKLSLFAWNLGLRGDFASMPRCITDTLTKSELLSLASVYFAKVHVIYAVVERSSFLQAVDSRWSCSGQQGTHSYDPVLCGVAALGYFFSRSKPEAKELEVAKCARLLLDESTSVVPSVPTVIGWMLRVIYLRVTSTPHAAWMASCTTMHMIEAAALHSEPTPDSILHRPADTCDPEYRRRIFGVAQHLNIWISFDLGRSRVALRGTSSLPPTRSPDHVTAELLDFLPLSETLDPDNNPDSSDLEEVLANVLASSPSHPASRLTQCNLMLCVYRRLRALHHNISGQLLDEVLACCTRGIRSSKEFLENAAPWHHVAYVPFQIICILLAIDTRAALNQLEFAMETLAAVAAAYATDSMKEAYKTARLLVLLHQKRKEEDARMLGGVLKFPQAAQPTQDGHGSSSQLPIGDGAADLSWLDDLALDMSGLEDFDWNQFLTDDASWSMTMPEI